VRWSVLAVLAAALLLACQEDLVSPADCPALCPGGQPQIIDEVLAPITNADSSFQGYVFPHGAQALLVSNGLRSFEDRAVTRFPSRPDSVAVRDTLRSYVIDSVAFGFNIVARDTNLAGLQLLLYRLSPLIDSTTTYAQVDPAFVPENLITAIPIPNDLNSGAVRTVLQGADLARVEIPPADAGELAVGIRLDAAVVSGVRLGAVMGGTGGVFVTYVTLNVPDTGSARIRNFPLTATFNSTLSPQPEVDDSTLLEVGGMPAARSLLRFSLPARIRDSANIVRATLELTPVSPIGGLPTDPVRLRARTVLSDVGAKSPLQPANALLGVAADTVEPGTSGTVGIEMVRVVQQWLLEPAGPTAVMLSLFPELEGASFSRPVFYSSRAADPALRPRLRLSYLLTFPFENP
jgi:hypothetical protein